MDMNRQMFLNLAKATGCVQPVLEVSILGQPGQEKQLLHLQVS